MAKVRKRPVVVQAMQLRYDTVIQTPRGPIEGRTGDWLMEDIELLLTQAKEGKDEPCQKA